MPATSALLPEHPVERLKGIGSKLAALLAEAGVRRIADLLLQLPTRYEDRARVVPITQVGENDRGVLIRARARQVRTRRGGRRRITLVEAVLEDASGCMLGVWFNQPWIHRRLASGAELYLYGAVGLSPTRQLQLVNPEIEEDDAAAEGVVPVYSKLGPLGGQRLRRVVEQALAAADRLADPLPEALRQDLGLPALRETVVGLHRPLVGDDEPGRARLVEELNARRSAYHRRLAFDELLAFACGCADYRARRLQQRAPACLVDDRMRHLARSMLPFRLTGAQRRVIGEIAGDLVRSHPMARLVQGDVGSGKTVVAALAMLIAVASGHQAALMAPTELLAEQHLQSLRGLFESTPFQPSLLVGSQAAAEQRAVREGLASGEVRLVVGTHALFQSSVEFRSLGLAVVDEQHRFGVTQRQALLDKGVAPHLLVMTATPIPRSLAMTLYGDLELSLIDELPPGRQPVKTVIRNEAARPRLYRFLAQELAEGGRAFVVYPLIEASENVDARALGEHLDELRQALPQARVEQLHGRMSRDEREAAARRFRNGEAQVLAATTVVEVGVDVPEATVMVIESAERFGLSQLHQLRGRVGRGRRRAWCVLLVGPEVSHESRQRLELFCSCQDGFEIAEADLRLRGPGELAGTRQWGPSQLRFADLLQDMELVQQARDVARRLARSGELDRVRSALSSYHRVDLDLPAG